MHEMLIIIMPSLCSEHATWCNIYAVSVFLQPSYFLLQFTVHCIKQQQLLTLHTNTHQSRDIKLEKNYLTQASMLSNTHIELNQILIQYWICNSSLGQGLKRKNINSATLCKTEGSSIEWVSIYMCVLVCVCVSDLPVLARCLGLTLVLVLDRLQTQLSVDTWQRQRRNTQ